MTKYTIKQVKEALDVCRDALVRITKAQGYYDDVYREVQLVAHEALKKLTDESTASDFARYFLITVSAEVQYETDRLDGDNNPKFKSKNLTMSVGLKSDKFPSHRTIIESVVKGYRDSQSYPDDYQLFVENVCILNVYEFANEEDMLSYTTGSSDLKK